MINASPPAAGVEDPRTVTPELPEDVRAYSPDTVAELLEISRRQVYELMNSGELASFKVRTSRRVRHTALVAYIEARDAR